jgi:4,5-dihydroxyphthalate decarboxylase
VPIEDGKDMEAMLISGELDAAIGVAVEHENIRTLIDQPFDAAVAAVRHQGIYPINHLMVVRDDVLEQNPDIVAELFDLFVRSKQLYLETLRNGGIAAPTKIDQIHAAVDPILGDPLPYGIESNRLVLETLVKHARDQNIITKPVEIDTLFAPACRDLNG